MSATKAKGGKLKAVRPKRAKWVTAEAPAGAIRKALLAWANTVYGKDGWAIVSVHVSHQQRSRGDCHTMFTIQNEGRDRTV